MTKTITYYLILVSLILMMKNKVVVDYIPYIFMYIGGLYVFFKLSKFIDWNFKK